MSLIDPTAFDINVLIGLATVFFAIGVIAAIVAKKTNFPRVTIIMLMGVLLGVISRQFDIFPLDVIPEGLNPLIKLTLIVVLFYGGLSVDIENIYDVLRPGILLATIGAFVTATVIGLTMNFFFEPLFLVGGGLILALILGALLAPNDPVAVFSAVESAGLTERPNTIAKMESGLDDTMVTTLTLAIFLPMVGIWNGGSGAVPLSQFDQFIYGIGFFIWLTVTAVIIGALFGVVTYYFATIIDDITTVRLMSVVMAFLCFFLAEEALMWLTIPPSSGYVAVFTMGMVMARFFVGKKENTSEYHQITSMWSFAFRLGEIFAFVVLGALVDLDAIFTGKQGGTPLIIPAIFLVILLTCVTRPIGVMIFTARTGLEFKEKIYIMFVALKGLDPAVLSIAAVTYYQYSLSSSIDISFIITLTFSVILLLTIVQSVVLWSLFREGGIFNPNSENLSIDSLKIPH